MGQKCNPIVLRLGLNRTWDSRWYSSGTEYVGFFHDDLKIRSTVKKMCGAAGIAQTVIERINKKVKISVYVSRPGLIIGKKGGELEKIKASISSIVKDEVIINIVEVKKPETSAQLVADNIATQLEKLVPYRRAVKKAISSAIRLGVGGIKIACSGRLGGVEIARCEHYKEGRIPLHTLRASIDYGVSTAFTAYGACGIKVWIFRKNVYKTNVFAFDTFLTS